METKTKVKLVGTDGNVFSIMGKVSAALKNSGRKDLAKEFMDKAKKSGSYDEVLRLTMEYVDVE